MNQQYFTTEQIENGDMARFVELLIKQSCNNCTKEFNDIHLRCADENYVVVEWSQCPWDGSWGGQWQFVNADLGEAVLKEYIFPDNHTEFFETKDAYEDTLHEWLKEHEDEHWTQDDYGNWVQRGLTTDDDDEDPDMNVDAACE